ncbi:multidrug resistance protein mdtG [Emericellopsis atlantica]|uniref:Multidrug resistance protein mdtG n=1 Tax=Emericellopsis atlantica TaxID=2614577 RepID=A0A9P7ZG22_9HYPO|nr:multidrug resistance protein mdtG [Emericellopsis atlantica]KAG9251276.1 multidrug resistance protein mdtG [Emericellopsis atlantica]
MAPSSIESRSTTEASERSPLLGSGLFPRRDDNSFKDPKSDPPTARLQVLLLCFARLMEPLAFFSIFPYVAEMVQRNGNLPDSDVGFYTGLVESLFSATQAVVLVFWGSWADRVGRKTMLLYSLVGMTIGTALFGMASEIWQMVLFRSVTGLFSGANLIIRTMIGEHCTPETQATFFSWYAVAGNMGLFLGPIIGGALVNPASQYPSIFGGIQFLEDYPYALPGLVVAAINATAALSSLLLLEETLHVNTKTDQPGMSDHPVPEVRSPQLSMRQLLQIPKVASVLYVYGYVMFLAIAFTAMHPVVLYTSVGHGGFGFSTARITMYITAVGATETAWLMFAFPFLQRRAGTKSVLLTCAWAWPLFFGGYVVVNALLRAGGDETTSLAIVVGAVNVVLGPAAFMSFTAVQLAVNEASPSPDVLGKLNSVAEIGFSVIRSIVPGVATAVFAAGVRGNILSGYLAWVVLIAFALGVPLVLRRFPDDMDQPGPVEERCWPDETCWTTCPRSEFGSVRTAGSIRTRSSVCTMNTVSTA